MTALRGSRAVAPALAVLNAAVDAALIHRVRLHQDRKHRRIDPATYKAGLKAVRDVEDQLEPLRRELGAEATRAMERSTC